MPDHSITTEADTVTFQQAGLAVAQPSLPSHRVEARAATFPARRRRSAPKKVAIASNVTPSQAPAARVALGVAACVQLAATCVLVALVWDLLNARDRDHVREFEPRTLLAVLAVSVGADLVVYGLFKGAIRSAPWYRRATPRLVRRVVSLRAVVQRASGAAVFGGLIYGAVLAE